MAVANLDSRCVDATRRWTLLLPSPRAAVRRYCLMSNLAIRWEGLSKQYRIGAPYERYKALRDVITDAAAAPFRRIRASRNGHGNSNGHHQPNTQVSIDDTYIWALDD